MTRAIVVAWHKYTPFGSEFYQPLFDFFIHRLSTMMNEYDRVYFVDSTWNFTEEDYKKIKSIKGEVRKVNPSLTYSDAYKEVLPQIKEDAVLFMDNDMVVYEEGKIARTFQLLEQEDETWDYDVVTILDTIGEFKTDKLNGKNKFCSYWFAARRNNLLSYTDIDWNSHMPHSETLGYLTQAMLNDGAKVYEWPEDKSGVMFDGSEQYPEHHKEGGLGYYHIRSGTTPAYLLATRKYGDKKTYDDYLKNQPRNELLRHLAWYDYILREVPNWRDLANYMDIIDEDLNIELGYWTEYMVSFRKYHGL